MSECRQRNLLGVRYGRHEPRRERRGTGGITLDLQRGPRHLQTGRGKQLNALAVGARLGLELVARAERALQRQNGAEPQRNRAGKEVRRRLGNHGVGKRTPHGVADEYRSDVGRQAIIGLHVTA